MALETLLLPRARVWTDEKKALAFKMGFPRRYKAHLDARAMLSLTPLDVYGILLLQQVARRANPEAIPLLREDMEENIERIEKIGIGCYLQEFGGKDDSVFRQQFGYVVYQVAKNAGEVILHNYKTQPEVIKAWAELTKNLVRKDRTATIGFLALDYEPMEKMGFYHADYVVEFLQWTRNFVKSDPDFAVSFYQTFPGISKTLTTHGFPAGGRAWMEEVKKLHATDPLQAKQFMRESRDFLYNYTRIVNPFHTKWNNGERVSQKMANHVVEELADLTLPEKPFARFNGFMDAAQAASALLEKKRMYLGPFLREAPSAAFSGTDLAKLVPLYDRIVFLERPISYSTLQRVINSDADDELRFEIMALQQALHKKQERTGWLKVTEEDRDLARKTVGWMVERRFGVPVDHVPSLTLARVLCMELGKSFDQARAVTDILAGNVEKPFPTGKVLLTKKYIHGSRPFTRLQYETQQGTMDDVFHNLAQRCCTLYPKGECESTALLQVLDPDMVGVRAVPYQGETQLDAIGTAYCFFGLDDDGEKLLFVDDVEGKHLPRNWRMHYAIALYKLALETECSYMFVQDDVQNANPKSFVQFIMERMIAQEEGIQIRKQTGLELIKQYGKNAAHYVDALGGTVDSSDGVISGCFDGYKIPVVQPDNFVSTDFSIQMLFQQKVDLSRIAFKSMRRI